jgi:hypothetical protein
VLLSLFLAPATIKKRKHSNQPKPITHPIQSHPSTQREKQGKNTLSQERKLLFACFVAVLVTWMSFASDGRELRGGMLSMLETHIVMSHFHASPRTFSRALPRTSSGAWPQFAHGPNHHSYGFGPRENRFEPRCFGYGPRPYRGDRFLCRPGFPVGGSFPHYESRHLDGTRFPCHGSRPTRLSGEVQRTMKTSSGRMVKCWIPKIYLTNPNTESSTFSRPM